MNADALERWIEALHHPGDEQKLRAAVTPEIVVERHAPAPRGETGELAATLRGIAAIGAWIRLAPPGGTFWLATPPRVEGTTLVAEYGYRIESLVNGGIWIASLVAGRIGVLAHRPYALQNQ
jgi:hypothetical protein